MKPNNLLNSVVQKLGTIHDDLGQVSDRCEEGGEGRIAFEIKQAMRQITHTIVVADICIRGEKLPTVEDARSVVAQYNDPDAKTTSNPPIQ